MEHRVRWIGCEQVFRGSICEFCLYHHGHSNAWETWYAHAEPSLASDRQVTSLGKNYKGYMPKDLRCKSCNVDIIPICGTWLHRNRPFATRAIPIRRATSILGESRSREGNHRQTYKIQVRIQGCRSHLLLVSPTIRWPMLVFDIIVSAKNCKVHLWHCRCPEGYTHA